MCLLIYLCTYYNQYFLSCSTQWDFQLLLVSSSKEPRQTNNEWSYMRNDHVGLKNKVYTWCYEGEKSCWGDCWCLISNTGHVVCQWGGVLWNRPFHHPADQKVRQGSAGGHVGHPAGHHRATAAADPGTQTNAIFFICERQTLEKAQIQFSEHFPEFISENSYTHAHIE